MGCHRQLQDDRRETGSRLSRWQTSAGDLRSAILTRPRGDRRNLCHPEGYQNADPSRRDCVVLVDQAAEEIALWLATSAHCPPGSRSTRTKYGYSTGGSLVDSSTTAWESSW